MSSSRSVLTADLWEKLRKNALELAVIPDWALRILSMPFGEACHLPTYPSKSKSSRPKAHSHETESLVRFLEKCQYAWGEDEKRINKLRILKEQTCASIFEVEMTNVDGLCRIFFNGETYKPFHIELLPAQFVETTSQQTLLLAWRPIAITVLLLGLVTYLIAYITAPTTDGAFTMFSISLLIFFLIVLKYGSNHIIEAAIAAFIVAILGGFLIGPLARAKQHRQEIQQQQQMDAGNH